MTDAERAEEWKALAKERGALLREYKSLLEETINKTTRLRVAIEIERDAYKATLIEIHTGRLSRDEMDLAAEAVLTEWEQP